MKTGEYAVMVRHPGFIDRFIKQGAIEEVDISGYGYTNEPDKIWRHKDRILANQVAELFRKKADGLYRFVVMREVTVKVKEWEACTDG